MFRVESKSVSPAAQAEFSAWALRRAHALVFVRRLRRHTTPEISRRTRVIREIRWAAVVAAAEIGAAKVRRRLRIAGGTR